MKPSLAKGTRDFLPEEVYKREYIFNIIRSVFETYAYVPIETPTFENLSTLTGKYGDEGDKLLFKILNNGDYLDKADKAALEEKDSHKLLKSISKRGLRYDLTVPFARYVVQHRNDLQFPFKRYQIQPVWRADRPQKGRYNEFYQCDVDVVGSKSLVYEAELVQIYDEVFSKLGLEVKILVNNRKILYGYAEALGLEDKFMTMTVTLDKLDKIGEEKVLIDLEGKGISREKGETLLSFLGCKTLAEMENALSNAPTGLKGIEELKEFHRFLDQSDLKNEVTFDPSLARGLSYYTGCIFEVKAKGIEMGSIGGGGRYDDLTSMFGLKDVSGVGVSFGFARIFDVMEELSLYPTEIDTKTKVMISCMDEESLELGFRIASRLRKEGIKTDIYPEAAKMKKQLNYANGKNIPFVVIVGERERELEKYVLKNMTTGEQSLYNLGELIQNL